MASAVRVFLAFLLLAPVLEGNWFQPVTYEFSRVCALAGSTVNISCIYKYPYKLNRSDLVKSRWITQSNRNLPYDLLSDPSYAGRVEYSCGSSACKWETCKRTCILTITDLRTTDSANYKFRPITDQTITDGGAVKLTVTGLEIKEQYSYKWYLECQAKCHTTNKFIWYRNGEKIHNERESKLSNYHYKNSYSCAVEGYERFHSPFWCNRNGDHYCRKVLYNARAMCALQGTTVDIKCTHNAPDQSTSKYWYIWRDNQTPRDITQDNVFARRFQDTDWTGRDTLRITGLRVTDSAEYRFKFISRNFEWGSSLPGTTLTVTGLRVEVTPVATVTEGHGVTLSCVAGCPLTHEPSNYNWYQNKQRLNGSESAKRLLSLDRVAPLHAGNYSCSVARNEGHRSPEETLTVLCNVCLSNRSLIGSILPASRPL